MIFFAGSSSASEAVAETRLRELLGLDNGRQGREMKPEPIAGHREKSGSARRRMQETHPRVHVGKGL
jgi:hypothetical protein